MKTKRFLGMLLSLALLATPALAAETDGGIMLLSAEAPESELLLPAVNAYGGFADVAEADWFYQGVKTCYESGLMNGTGAGNFSPSGVMSTAESAVIAARLGAIAAGDTIPPGGEGAVWYAPYLDYLRPRAPELEAVVAAEPERSATRSEFFALLSAVTTDELLAPVNSIDALPDVDAGDPVLDFYNAGILTGVDEAGTFAGDKTLTRAECAVMVARLADPSQRKVGVVPPSVGHVGVGDGDPAATPAPETPAPETPAPSPDPAAPIQPEPETPSVSDPGPTVMTVNGQAISRADFVAILNDLIYDVDYNLYRQGTRLDWNADYGVGNLKTFFLDQAVSSTVRSTILDAQAAANHCTVNQLPAALYPDPGYAVLSASAQQNDYLGATHVLVSDSDTAKAVLDGLSAVPTLEQFNALLTVFGTDPGMESNPDGYLFSANEMVPQFEAGTRALEIGSYTTEPVQSEFGYHIIWRLDPANHPELLTQYQYSKTLEMLNQQAEQAQVSVDQAAIQSIDPQVCYTEFMAQ